MTTERVKIIDKAKKLRELATRGVDGEKDNAIRMYGFHKNKHGLTDSDVDGHKYSEDFMVNFSKMSDAEYQQMMTGVIKLANLLADVLFRKR
jgi:hypothetical protein